jgi:hypothetical protein
MKKYSNIQLAFALDQVLKKHRQEMEKPVYPESKVQWIKQSAIKIIDLLEEECKRFNKLNQGNGLDGNDIVSSISTALNCVLREMGLEQIKD